MKFGTHPLTFAGICVGFVMTAFVATWMLQGHLEPGDKMWATIIMCSTVAVMFVFIGEQNRRERVLATELVRRDAVRDRHMKELIDKAIQEMREQLLAGIGDLIRTAHGDGYSQGYVDGLSRAEPAHAHNGQALRVVRQPGEWGKER